MHKDFFQIKKSPPIKFDRDNIDMNYTNDTNLLLQLCRLSQ